MNSFWRGFWAILNPYNVEPLELVGAWLGIIMLIGVVVGLGFMVGAALIAATVG